MPLNPLLEQLLKEMAESQAPPIHELPPAMAREMYRQMQNVRHPVQLPRVEDFSIPGPGGALRLRAFYPVATPASPLPVALFFHGGGWVIGDLDTHEPVCRALAEGTGAAVLSVDYRLAPEAPFPAAFDDCLAAVDWVAAEGAGLNLDPARLAVVGDSAGGNLAATVALAARDRGPNLLAQVLVYPVTDTSLDYPSHLENGAGYLLTREAMEYFIATYIPDAGQRGDARVAPNRVAELGKLPPALVITAEFDPLRDEGEEYAKRLEAAGNQVQLTRYDGMIHGFFNMAELLEDARTAMEEACRFLRERLAD